MESPALQGQAHEVRLLAIRVEMCFSLWKVWEIPAGQAPGGACWHIGWEWAVFWGIGIGAGAG